MRFVLLLAAAAFVAVPAGAIDLTGTWEGSFNCKVFDGDKFKVLDKGQLLQITQDMDELFVEWVGVAPLEGIAIDDNSKPDEKGAVALVDCATNTDLTTGFAELANLQAKVNRAKGKGTLKGTSVYTGGGSEVGQCKWKFKLIDLTDPVVPGCP